MEIVALIMSAFAFAFGGGAFIMSYGLSKDMDELLRILIHDNDRRQVRKHNHGMVQQETKET